MHVLGNDVLSRRKLLFGVSAATVMATAALADTPFTTFSFPRALPNGTGTTPNSQTVPVRDGVKVNVKDFGAKGDGSTDDTASIQSAINWVSGSTDRGTVYFPVGTYHTTSALQLPVTSNIILTGDGDASAISGNFNGFILDGLSSPYNADSQGTVIEKLRVTNGFAGNNFSVAANGTWSSSGSPVNITLSGGNPGVVAGAILFTNDQRASANVQLIGVVTSVSWPTVTVSSAAVGSGATSNLIIQIVQAYAAGASWSNNASTITMGSSAPTGISGNGSFYIWDYNQIQSNAFFQFTLGVATWSGTTLTFTAGTGALGASVGSSDLLIFAPISGAIRLSSVVVASVRDCFLSGFIGITSSEDKIVANDPSAGGAEGFHISIDSCNITPVVGAAAVGQTGVYVQNNSIVKNCNFNSWWCAIRLSGTACAVYGGRIEICYYGIILNGDGTASNNSSVENVIQNMSMESNLLGIFVDSAGTVVIEGVGIANNALNAFYGMYLVGGSAGHVSIISCASRGHYQSNYAVYIGDYGANAGNITFISSSFSNIDTPSQGWRIPAQAWWGTCIQCDNPALVYTFANLPSGVSSPTPTEGDTYIISDAKTTNCSDSACNWGANVTAGAGSLHRQVRWNGSNWTVMGQ